MGRQGRRMIKGIKAQANPASPLTQGGKTRILSAKTSLKPHVIASLEKTGGWNVQAACLAAGITVKTFYDWVKADGRFAGAIEEIRQQSRPLVEDALFQCAVTPDPKCHADRKFYLTNMGRDRWKDQSVITAEGQIELKHTAAYEYVVEAAARAGQKVIEGKVK